MNKKLFDEGAAERCERTDDSLYAGGPKYPYVKVQLSGSDGNAFMIIGNVMSAMKKAGLPKDKVDAFFKEARSGDYDHLLQTCMLWVDVS